MPESFDVGSRPVSGAFFVRGRPAATYSQHPVDEALAHRDRARPMGGAEHLVWTREGEPPTLKEALLAMIRGARRKIFIASYRIGDDELFEELFEAADRLRGSVYVITLVDEKSLAKGLAETDDDSGADTQALNKQFGPLVERGLYVRGHDSCHAKFVVVDDEIALVSSANLETRAFTTTTEVGLVVRDKGEVGRLARFFTRLWHECTWEVAPGSAYTVAKRAATEAPSLAIPEPATRQHVIWTHHRVHTILHAAHEAIEKAERDVLLASFSLKDMAVHRDLLLTHVERFMKRTGGRVRLLVRARNQFASHRRDAEELAALGCVVLGDRVNHAKCVIADDKEAVLFSANFDAEHGLTSGVEAGVRLVEPPLVRRATMFFNGLLQAAPMTLAVSPSHTALQALAAGWIHPWPEQATVRLRASDADWNTFIDLGAGRPMLFEQGTDGRLVLITGRAVFFLLRVSGEAHARLEPGPSAGTDSSSVLEKWLEAKQPSPARRGICPAVFVRG